MVERWHKSYRCGAKGAGSSPAEQDLIMSTCKVCKGFWYYPNPKDGQWPYYLECKKCYPKKHGIDTTIQSLFKLIELQMIIGIESKKKLKAANAVYEKATREAPKSNPPCSPQAMEVWEPVAMTQKRMNAKVKFERLVEKYSTGCSAYCTLMCYAQQGNKDAEKLGRKYASKLALDDSYHKLRMSGMALWSMKKK